MALAAAPPAVFQARLRRRALLAQGAARLRLRRALLARDAAAYRLPRALLQPALPARLRSPAASAAADVADRPLRPR